MCRTDISSRSSALDALAECKVGWPAVASDVSVHMDGSYEPNTDQAAWSFEVIMYDDDE